MIALLIIFVFFFTNLFGYLVHRSFHQSWTSIFHRAHMAHHLKLYPISDFSSEKYRSAGSNSTVYLFIIAAIPIIIFPFLLAFWGLISYFIAIIIVVEMVAIGLLDNYLHDSFHIKDHWLNRSFLSKPYKRCLNLHYLHHVDMNSNFGIFEYLFDKVFKTYRKE